MICYRDMTYCDSDSNGCTHRQCIRHLQNSSSVYALANNKDKLPVSLDDFSVDCETYEARNGTQN